MLERGNGFTALVQGSKDVDALHCIFAGKFRRYHGESLLQHLLDITTIFKNIRDFFLMLMGIVQSFFLLLRLRPDAVFIKGGFVGVPIGLVCALFKIPFITHDSDTVPGLANKIVGRWAKIHATGMPTEFYNSPKDKLRYVGIPLAAEYQQITKSEQAEYRKSIDVPVDASLLVVTGGSLGAVRLNNAVLAAAETILQENPKLYIFHQTGGQQDNIYHALPAELHSRVVEKQFVDNLYAYLAAGDLVLARAGATTIAEIGALKKACVLVPNPALTGGQQTKNAAHLDEKNAAVILSEDNAANATVLSNTITSLLASPSQRQELANNLHEMIKTDAAEEIVKLIVAQAEAG